MVAETYQDLVDQINYYELRINQYNAEIKKLLLWSGHPGGIKSTCFAGGGGGSRQIMSAENILDRVNEIDNICVFCLGILEMLQEQKRIVDDMLKNLEGMQYKIFYLKRIENKTFPEIAKEIGKSERQIIRLWNEVIMNEQCGSDQG